MSTRIFAISVLAASLLAASLWSVRAAAFQSGEGGAGTQSFTPTTPAAQPPAVAGTPFAAAIDRAESTSEALAGAVQLGEPLRTADGVRSVRVLGLYLQLQRDVESDGPVFCFNQQSVVLVDGADPVVTERFGGKDAAGTRFSYRFEVRPAAGRTWGSAGALSDLIVQLVRE